MGVDREAGEGVARSVSVFLSYARPDSAKAKNIVKALEGQGFSVWWDGLISGGHEYSDRIQQALSDADAVVVLWSKHSAHSHWVRDEAGFARDRNRLVPATLDGSDMPLGFRQIQSIDLSRWRGGVPAAQIEQLADAVRAIAGEDPSPAPQPTASLWSRRKVLIGAGVGVAAIAGLGGVTLWQRHARIEEAASIAVLPFRSVGGAAATGYFADGLAEELRATLSRVAQLSVAAQTSSDSFRDGKADARSAAKALGVAYLLEGSIRQAVDMIRVSTRIVDGRTGLDRWSQTFDRPSGESLSIQTDIAAFVTDALLAGLAEDERPSERIGGTRNTQAFNAFLKGSALYDLSGGEESDFQALAAFDQAVKLDPNYAAAHAARSRVLTFIANNYLKAGEIQTFYRRSVEAAKAAIRIAPDFAEGYSALGFVLFNGQLDARLAEAPYERSFELGYGNADILSAYANYAARVGQFDQGREAILRAERLDPLNPTVFRNAGLLEYAARDYPAAQVPLKTALSLNAKARIVNSMLGDVALMQGDVPAAKAYYGKEPDEPSRWRGLAIAEAKLGQQPLADQAYATLIKVGKGVSHYQQAQVMAQWGRRDEALGLLEQAFALRDAGLVRLRNDPLLDPVRSDERFAAIARSIGFA